MTDIDFNYFLENWDKIDYDNNNILIYLDYLQKNNLENSLKFENLYFLEHIVIKYVVDKCQFLEHIYNIPFVKDFIRRSVGDFDYCDGNDYLCARFHNTNESLQYVAKFYNYDLFQVINLEDNYNVTDEGLIGFNPKIIIVENCNITSHGIKHMTNLKELYIRSNINITDDAIENLNLELLYLGRTEVTNFGISKQKNLKKLIVRNNKITDDCISKCKSLEYLDLSYSNSITDIAIKNLSNLQSLCLDSNLSITNFGIINLINLKHLDLSYNEKITDDALINLTNLETLDLSDNENITDNGISGLVNLKGLSLNSNSNKNITDKGIENLKKLEKLFLNRNKNITISAVRNLNNLKEITILNSNILEEDLLFDNIKIICSTFAKGY